MSRFPRALLLLAGAAAGTCAAQSCSLGVTGSGGAALVTCAAEGLTAQDLFTRLSGALGLPLRTRDAALEALAAEKPVVRVADMPAADVVEHLAGSAGLEGRIEDGVITITSYPAAGDPELPGRLRASALAAARRASVLPGTKPEVPFAYRIGLLHLGGGDCTEALLAFRIFYENDEGHPLAARARLLAARCASDSGGLPEARSILEGLERHHGDAPEILRASLELARIQMLAGVPAEAVVRLHRVIREAADVRLEGLAVLQLTELHLRLGDPATALRTLETFDADLRRALPDLAERVPLYTGLCLVAKGAVRESVPHFQLAVLRCEDPATRVRGTVELVKAYAALGEHTTAILAAEAARRMRLEGPRLREVSLLLGELHAGCGNPVLARRHFERALAEAGPADRIAFRARKGLAHVLFRERKWDEARELFAGLAREDGEDALPARMMAARCDVGRSEWRAAIETLAAVPEDAPEGIRREAAGLCGRCWMELGDFARASLACQGAKTTEER